MHLKKSQVWILDLFFALLIFVAVLVIFFKSELNLSDNDEQSLDNMLFESRLVSDSLLSTGFPANWQPTNVTEIGISNNYRINNTKLSMLQSMDYSLTRSKLRTRYEYYFYFVSGDGIERLGSGEGVGKPGVDSSNIVALENPQDLVTLSRFVIFRSKPAKLVIYLWD